MEQVATESSGKGICRPVPQALHQPAWEGAAWSPRSSIHPAREAHGQSDPAGREGGRSPAGATAPGSVRAMGSAPREAEERLSSARGGLRAGCRPAAAAGSGTGCALPFLHLSPHSSTCASPRGEPWAGLLFYSPAAAGGALPARRRRPWGLPPLSAEGGALSRGLCGGQASCPRPRGSCAWSQACRGLSAWVGVGRLRYWPRERGWPGPRPPATVPASRCSDLRPGGCF